MGHDDYHDLDTLLGHSEGLRRLALSLAPHLHDAEDLLQELWLNVIRQSPRGIADLSAWLRGMLRNLARGTHRRGQRRRARETRVGLLETGAQEDTPAIERWEIRAHICREVLSMNPHWSMTRRLTRFPR